MRKLLWLISLPITIILSTGCQLDEGLTTEDKEIQEIEPILSVNSITAEKALLDNGILLGSQTYETLHFEGTLNENCDDSNETTKCTGLISSIACNESNDFCSSYTSFECTIEQKSYTPTIGQPSYKSVLQCYPTGAIADANIYGMTIPDKNTTNISVSAKLYKTLSSATGYAVSNIFSVNKSGFYQ